MTRQLIIHFNSINISEIALETKDIGIDNILMFYKNACFFINSKVISLIQFKTYSHEHI